MVSVLFVAVLGLLALVANYDLLILRNANAYAVTAHLLLQGQASVSEIITNYELGAGKPILFSLFSVPFVELFGLNSGMLVSSFVSTLLFLFCSVFFFRRFNRILGLSPDLLSLQIILTFFNPLMIYQFWSAYADSLFAALSVGALVFLDMALREKKGFYFNSAAYFALVYLSILTKYIGGILLLGHLLYVFFHLQILRKNILQYKEKSLWLLSLVAAVSLLILAALAGKNPTLYLASGAGGGFEGKFNLFETLVDIPRNIASFLVLLVFVFNVLAIRLYVPKLQAFRPLFAMTALCLIPYFIFYGSYFNIRFYLPFFPFGALIISSTFEPRWKKKASRILFILFLLGNGLLIGVFNHQGLYTRVFGARELPPFFDNLRMREHLSRSCLENKIEMLSTRSPLIVQWTFDYYHALDLRYLRLLQKKAEFRELGRFEETLAGPGEIYLYAFLPGDVFTKEIPEPIQKRLSQLELEDKGCNLYRVVGNYH